MKIITVVGARPQFVKAAAVSREIARQKTLGKDIEEVIVHTGQHFDPNMSDVFFEEMSIPRPDYNLNIHGLSHGAMTGQMLEKIEEVLLKEKPDWVLVYGDTNSTIAGALAAKKLHIKVAHVEAGLRSFNMKMPEEINRILTDRISDLLFPPTDTAVENLMTEGFDKIGVSIVKCGDVMCDASVYYAPFAKQPSFMDNADEQFVLCTIHRAENTDDKDRITSIIEALNEVAKDKRVVLPLHPRTKNILAKLGLNVEKLTIVEPVGYFEMIWLLQHCDLVLTDSGGLQKEAFFFGKYCVTMRDETEWTELVKSGVNCLVGADKDSIVKIVTSGKALSDEVKQLDLYGRGDASEKIIEGLLRQ
ncbi:MAG: non-hydrolyzing UDP-N-acetylglucosamine 2-epimerase [Deferribacterales bacterium]